MTNQNEQPSEAAREKAKSIMSGHSGLCTFSPREHELIRQYALEFDQYEQRLKQAEKLAIACEMFVRWQNRDYDEEIEGHCLMAVGMEIDSALSEWKGEK